MTATIQTKHSGSTWQQLDEAMASAPCDPLIELDHQLLTELIQLALIDARNIEQLRTMVRQIMLDRIFAGECGDCIAGQHFDEHIDELIEHVVQWLNQVRESARRHQGDPPSANDWSER